MTEITLLIDELCAYCIDNLPNKHLVAITMIMIKHDPRIIKEHKGAGR